MKGYMKKILGERQMNDDGFTYVYGAHKSGRIARTRNRKQVARCVRSDKRTARFKDLREENALVD